MSLRTDRTVTLLLKRLGGKQRAGIPILMYHDVEREYPQKSHPYFETVITPGVLAAHLQLIQSLGYTVLPLEALAGASPFAAGGRKVVITFDDAFAGVYESAFPLLAQYGYPATVFVPTAFIDSGEPGLEGKRHLSWQQMREMTGSGISFGSHTVHHVKLTEISPAAAAKELTVSKATLEEQLGRPVTSFSCPYAFPEHNKALLDRLTEQLAAAGYLCGVSTRLGLSRESDERFYRRRLPVNDYDDPALFQAKLEGCYDWLYPVQRGFKAVKRLLRK